MNGNLIHGQIIITVSQRRGSSSHYIAIALNTFRQSFFLEYLDILVSYRVNENSL